METGRLFQEGGRFARRLKAIEWPCLWSEKPEGVVVGTPHREGVHNRRDFAWRQAKRLRRMPNLAGFVNHGPFVKSMASEERSPVRRACEKLTKPLNDGSPFLRQRFHRHSETRRDVSRDAEVELRLIPSQGEANARMPSTQKRGAIRIILEKKIIHRMFHPL